VKAGAAAETSRLMPATNPGSGGQFIAFVPSLNLVVTRQISESGEWQFEEYLRRACQAVLAEKAE
jgi:hypothetical protein